MLTARSARPSAISRAAASEPPQISALASCIPKKIGLSSVPRPCPTPNGVSGADLTALRKDGTWMRWISSSGAGSGTIGSTPSMTPSSVARRMVRSSRTGSSGWSSPRS